MATSNPEKIVILRACTDETLQEVLARLRAENPSAQFTLFLQKIARPQWEGMGDINLLSCPSGWEYALPCDRETLRLLRHGNFDRAVLPIDEASGGARRAKLLLLRSGIHRREVLLPAQGWKFYPMTPFAVLGRLITRLLKALVHPVRTAKMIAKYLLWWSATLAAAAAIRATCLCDRLLRLDRVSPAEDIGRLRRLAARRISRQDFQHPPAPGLVSVVIPNWNGRGLLKTCLDSLQVQTYETLEIIVVDNGSTDGSAEYLQREFPHVQVVALPHNLGFAGAVNRGLAVSRGEFICLLNNDTEADPHFVEEQVKALKEDAFCGSTASKILWFHQRDMIQSAGDRYWRGGEIYWAGEGKLDDGTYDNPGYIFSACAAGAVYKREFFEEAGFFDESFHSYQEDVDLGFRGNLFGFRCRYVPTARLYHMVAKTGSKNPLWAFQTARNELSALLKNMPASLLRENCRLLIRVQKERVAAFNNTPTGMGFSKGKLALLLRLPGILRQRVVLQRARSADLSYLATVIDEKRSDRG